MTDERKRVEEAGRFYESGQLAVDGFFIEARWENWQPFLQGTSGLELGVGAGEMTEALAQTFDDLTVVDASQKLLDQLNHIPGISKVASLFEDFDPNHPFDTILMDHVLEHVEHPIEILLRAKSWLKPGGRILAGVPNAHSIHRLAAAHMGLLAAPDSLNERDVALGHRRVYTPTSFVADLNQAGLRVIHRGGLFLKPLSNQQIEDTWTTDMLRAFLELGKEFPDIAAEMFAVCDVAS